MELGVVRFGLCLLLLAAEIDFEDAFVVLHFVDCAFAEHACLGAAR